MQIFDVGETHVAACDINNVKVLLFDIIPADIEAWISKEYVAAFNNFGAIPEIVFPVRVNGVAVDVLEFPVLLVDIKL